MSLFTLYRNQVDIFIDCVWSELSYGGYAPQLKRVATELI